MTQRKKKALTFQLITGLAVAYASLMAHSPAHAADLTDTRSEFMPHISCEKQVANFRNQFVVGRGLRDANKNLGLKAVVPSYECYTKVLAKRTGKEPSDGFCLSREEFDAQADNFLKLDAAAMAANKEAQEGKPGADKKQALVESIMRASFSNLEQSVGCMPGPHQSIAITDNDALDWLANFLK